ncbi:diacylglycerol kinase [Candidatus Kaiserbacteria bacterium RIFCSPHIGHO2_01_FULL_49_13]|uniref:Diacylglycerol kinase n=1 Tax=Candidatus Kaiserbacteria bacterium RIFCSPHIGHO2_01_FULL_49_13 TaxID=1798477 RepID=A0A1F6CDH0_9BACT|nr:MAG: diacylglycerol kinase [Candidatus Kaiserbacteria bacterium RIFCSPHIGHO2_01_FULL_49_13]
MQSSEEKFSVMRRAKSFAHAWRGIRIFIKTTHNAWLHVAAFVLVIAASVYFSITRAEWIAITFAAGFVFAAEAFNTAIEIDMDLTSPEFHPFARDTKDVAAAAVLIAAVTAVVIGGFVFGPYIITP